MGTQRIFGEIIALIRGGSLGIGVSCHNDMFECRLGLGENKVLLLDDVVCRVAAKRPLVGWDLDDFPEW
ncbi:hypothetical protein GOBAR_AA16343 [Gossypium barbadense]|uniref:Uncharacterized protein n=1 Tax=Gossypium barbadense TaxID=3634 RepID=A0A2P5XLY6_GOSBA|nr:hypothetical protein GOBAR_AA16343 [Gossypium barbadense]